MYSVDIFPKVTYLDVDNYLPFTPSPWTMRGCTMVWRQFEGGGGWVKDLGVILVVGLGEACTHVAALLVAVEANMQA